MKKNNHHILRKVNLEVNTPEEKIAFEIKSRLDSFLRKELFTKVEKLFDQLSLANEIKRFESIQLNFELKHAEDIDLIASQFVTQLKNKLEQIDSEPVNFNTDWDKIENQHLANHQLNQASERSSDANLHEPGRTINHDSNLKNTFIYFLETGQLPWYAVPDLINEFVLPVHFAKALRDDRFRSHLKELFQNNETALDRFIYQFENKTIEHFLSRLMRDNKIISGDILSLISQQNHEVKKLIHKLIIKRLTNHQFAGSIELYQQIFKAVPENTPSTNEQEKRFHEIHEILQQAVNTSSTSKQSNENQNIAIKNYETDSKDLVNEASEQTEPLYFSNAGLIVCHPLLPELLKRCECTVDNKFIGTNKKQYAVHLLHFLSTGKEKGMEYELGFEKFLCGYEQNIPVDRNIILKDEHKQECLNVLQSILTNWSALKNTSIDGLRENFFFREGKLDRKKTPVKLYVGRNTIDILLEKLPWSISVVKLPWLNDIIFVEW